MVMRLALKSLGMAKNVIMAHGMRDMVLSISANAKLLLHTSEKNVKRVAKILHEI